MKRLICAFVCLAVTACSRVGPAAYAAGAPAETFGVAHTLRVAIQADLSTLNCVLGTDGNLGWLSQLTAAYLVRWNHENQPFAELATAIPTQLNGGVSSDGLTITYHLRHGVRWSDGAPFDADDVVFSTWAVLNPRNHVASRSGWDAIERIDEPDKYTVVYHLKRPYSPFVTTFFSSYGITCILPKHVLSRYADINDVPFNSLPIGIGPFQYVRWNRGVDVRMVANSRYWRGVPLLKEIDARFIPNANSLLAQLEGKSVDLWYPASPNFLPQLQQMHPFVVDRIPVFYYSHIDFNLSHPALADVAVRRALRYAVNRQVLIDKVMHGIGNVQEQPAPRTASYWDPSVTLTPFDIARANALLDKAGWRRGPDGVRSKGSVRLDLSLAIGAGNPDTDEEIELIRSWWQQIGVALEVRHYSSAQYFATYQDNGVLYTGQWDVAAFSWSADPLGDFSPQYGCDQFPPTGQNNVRWCNRRADAAMHALFRHYDRTQRDMDAWTVMQELDKDVPTIVLAGREFLFVENRSITGFTPGAITPFDEMMNVDLE